ncbi:hypothetical protein [Sporosarcina cyprini]|uniref:hypothetical protein n=1 Tax=Sporosarcina cyprini TaxID=2910523 RepID=UPI001EDDAFAE|nr:hypothetical protein [Sporosarcina cyprini]MCG3089824.1 hypothetical protein [Sporosarcina cyprini]
MKKIKIFLEYKCFPMWVYNENDELVENDLVEELKNDAEIDNMFVEIQSIYDGLYEDDAINFEFKGFTNEIEKNEFILKIKNATTLVREKVGNKYIIEKKLNF